MRTRKNLKYDTEIIHQDMCTRKKLKYDSQKSFTKVCVPEKHQGGKGFSYMVNTTVVQLLLH